MSHGPADWLIDNESPTWTDASTEVYNTHGVSAPGAWSDLWKHRLGIAVGLVTTYMGLAPTRTSAGDRQHDLDLRRIQDSLTRRISARGVSQDVEQDIFHSSVHGVEHGDWLLLRAPKPILLLTNLNDFFPIQGTRETIEEGSEDLCAAQGRGQFRVGAFILLEFFTGQFQVLRVFTHGLLELALLYPELTEL